MEDVIKMLNLGDSLLKRMVSDLSEIEGSQSMLRKLRMELKYLDRLKNDRKDFQRDHSNIYHLEAVIDASQRIPNIDRFEAPVIDVYGNKIILDIMAENGREWYKVIEKSAKVLHEEFINKGDGRKALDDLGKQLIKTALLYSDQSAGTPEVIFVFKNGVSRSFCNHISKFGITVRGVIIKDDLVLCPELYDTSEDNRMKPLSQMKHKKRSGDHDTVNLDVTCMLAYCSYVCNGGTSWQYANPSLEDQCKWEKMNPVVPEIEKHMQGKRIIACKEAITHFEKILSKIGGPEEKKRGADLIERIEAVDGVDTFKERLEVFGHVKPLPRLVFGTGHAYRAPTITSNSGFIGNCRSQGVSLDVLLHEARCLCELKKVSA